MTVKLATSCAGSPERGLPIAESENSEVPVHSVSWASSDQEATAVKTGIADEGSTVHERTEDTPISGVRQASADPARCAVRVTKDRLDVLLDYEGTINELDQDLDSIMKKLSEIEIANPPRKFDLKKLLTEKLESGNAIAGLSIAQGMHMVQSQDGRIEWTDDFFGKGFAVDSDSKQMNYRERTAHCNVRVGQLLATVIPPVPGKDGKDVFGKRLRVRRPEKARIRPGEGITLDAEKGRFYASTNGRIRWDEKRLTVDRIYTVPGSIDLKTGNVVHPGDLVVKKDITWGSRVEVDGDIEVDGVIEASTVFAGGDLTVHGGISGAGDEFIRVDGDLRAKFILDADLDVGGDVIVEREVVNSTIRAGGVLRILGGRIVGGEATALGGIETSQAGSEAAVVTTLVAGKDFRLQGLLEKKNVEIRALERKQGKILTSLEPLISRMGSLSSEKKHIVEQLANAAKAMAKVSAELSDEKKEIIAKSRKRAKEQIVIRSKLYPETILGFPGNSMVVKYGCDGPVRVVRSGKKIKVCSLSPPSASK